LVRAGLVQSPGVGQPGFGQVELQVQGVVPLGADVVDRDGDLAVGFLTQRTAVLPLDPNGVRALLGEGDVVEEEQAFGAGEGLAQVGAVALKDGLLIPRALVDELLEGLLGIGAGEAVG
jgi:hypothetical protein